MLKRDKNGINGATGAIYCNPISYVTGNEIASSICNKKANLAKKRYCYKYYPNLNEGQLRVISQYSSHKPKPRQGRSDNCNMDNKAKKKIYRAIRLMELRNEFLSFMTLGFGHNPSPDEARKMLDNFFQALRYHFRKKKQHFDYVWVLEIQPKRCFETGEIVPHFHVVTSKYIPKDLLNELWNKVVMKWQKSKGLPSKRTYPNIKAAKQTINGYVVKDESGKKHSLAKYLCKGNSYITPDGDTVDFPIVGKLNSMDTQTSKDIKANEKIIDSFDNFILRLVETLDNLKIPYALRKDYINNNILFSYDGQSVLNAILSNTLPMRHENDFYRKPIDEAPEIMEFIDEAPDNENQYEMEFEDEAPDLFPEYEMIYEPNLCQPCFYFVKHSEITLN